MKVKINIDDLPELSPYRDDRCEELEEILRNDPEYKTCSVRRLKQIDEYREQGDPFEIQNAQGKHIVWLYEYEVNILDDTELVWYAAAQSEREKESDIRFRWRTLTILLLFFGGSGLVLSIVNFIIFSSIASLLLLTSSIVLSCGLLCFHLVRKAGETRDRDIDLKYISEYPLYLATLRKLATLSSRGMKGVQDYGKRLRDIEDTLAGV